MDVLMNVTSPGICEQPGKLNLCPLQEHTQHGSLSSDYSHSIETFLGSTPQPLNLSARVFLLQERDAHCREPVISRSVLHAGSSTGKNFSLM